MGMKMAIWLKMGDKGEDGEDKDGDKDDVER